MGARKKATGPTRVKSGINTAAATETIVDLVSRLGLVDIVVGRLKAKVEETDIDELFDDVTDYMKRNPEVLVVTLGAITVAAGLLVFLNSRGEWDGMDRRRRQA
jgi:excinuclease UvrABC helicase subunit UvrB